MNTLADKVHKQEVPCTHALHTMATLFNSHPYYISSSTSGMPVDTKFTATYVGPGWLLNNVTMVWSAYHCVHGTSCLCTSTSARFLLEIFLWRLT